MAFIKVENFLQKLRKFSQAEDLGPKAVSVLKNKFPNAKLEAKIKNRVLYLSELSPALKNEIFLRKHEILSELKDTLGPKAPEEINFQKF